MAQRLIKSVREEYLSCGICLDLYREPKLLSCEHKFCRECLQNHVSNTLLSRNSRKYTTCPLCRQEVDVGQDTDETFDVRNWVSGLPSDSLVESLLLTLQRHESDMSEKSSNSLPVCQEHDGKTCDFYCFSHSRSICGQCAADNHKSCEYGSATEALQRLEPEINELRSSLGEYLSKANNMCRGDQEFEETKSKAMRDIGMMQQSLDEMYLSAKGQITSLKHEIDRCNGERLQTRKSFYEIVTKLLELNCSIEGIKEGKNNLQVLDAFPIMKTDVETVENELKEVDENDRSVGNKITFIENKCFRDFLSTYTGVGFIETESSALPNTESLLKSIPSTIAHILARDENTENVDEVTKQDDVTLKFSWNAKFETEHRFVPSGVLLVGAYVCVIDRENEKIKQFLIGGSFVDVIRMSGQPHDATMVNRLKEFAVTQPEQRLISFILADDTGLKSGRFISTNIAYYGICLLDVDTIVVSSWSMDCIHIIDTRGNVLKSIDRDVSRLKNVPDLLSVLGSGRIAITEVGCNVYGLDVAVNAHKHSSYAWCHAAPADVFGICSDGRGFVYACVKDRDEIMCIREDGELYNAAVLSRVDGINKPISVSCHKGLVLVGQEDGVIKIFQYVDHPRDEVQ